MNIKLLIAFAILGNLGTIGYTWCSDNPSCATQINIPSDKAGSGTPDYVLCNMSQVTVTGFPNWYGINESSYNFSMPPMSCLGIASHDAIKDIYWSTGSTPCTLDQKDNSSVCSYTNVSTDHSSSIVFGVASSNNEIWQGADEISDCATAVKTVLNCDTSAPYDGTECSCPTSGSACASPLFEWACPFACSSAGASGGGDDGSGGAE